LFTLVCHTFCNAEQAGNMNELANIDFSPSGSLPSVHGGVRPLSRKAKAAIVVRLLVNEGADIPLEALPDGLQAELTQQLGTMRSIDRDTLSAVVAEFADELESIGLSFPKGLAGALSMLDGKISAQTAARLRKEAGVRQGGDPWVKIKGLEIEELLPVLEQESIEIAAVVLSKLDVGKAAELLGKLPGPRARRITYAVSQTHAIMPDAVERIGLSLGTQLEAQPVTAFEDGPVERVGAILNSSIAATREDVLTGLEETDADFAQEVRKAIFTFANIPTRIAERDVPRIVRDVDQPQLVIALAYAQATGLMDASEHILSNMSSRMADALREEIGEAGTVKTKDGEAAMSEVVAAIRALQSSGELTLLSEDPEEDE
jgi:flagellar motor switch protein FliG